MFCFVYTCSKTVGCAGCYPCPAGYEPTNGESRYSCSACVPGKSLQLYIPLSLIMITSLPSTCDPFIKLYTVSRTPLSVWIPLQFGPPQSRHPQYEPLQYGPLQFSAPQYSPPSPSIIGLLNVGLFNLVPSKWTLPLQYYGPKARAK